MINVSIDDYGTGYSSLKLLEQVDFDTIKMDKSFADRIGTASGDIIFTSTTDMIKKLGKRIVCEGVETQKQIDFLRDINCNPALLGAELTVSDITNKEAFNKLVNYIKVTHKHD